MFPSNSFSDLHLQYTDKTLVNGRSFLPSDPVAYGLDDGLIFEQLLFPEEPVNEACDYGDINFPGSCNSRVEKADDGVDQAGLVDSADRSLCLEVCPSKKSRSKVTGSRKSRSMPRKRTGKTDRHSKIHTAKGLRDRRIRLSVHIARKFFDLQEMLGLDKASKTIEWLLAESQDAIDELCKQNCLHLSTNSTPESAMASEMKEPEEEEGEEKEEQVCGGSKNKEQFTNCMKRDSRDKARARARERTREKLMMKEPNLEDPKQIHEEENHNRPSLDGGFLCTPENGRVSDDFSAPEMNSLSIIEKFLGITSTAAKSSSFPDFDFGNDCYEMIEGINILEGLNHPKYADSVSGSAPNSW